MVNCLLVGVGGQGTVLASKIISKTAMDKGYQVCAAETIGMAQRGGSVVSHVKFGEHTLCPLIAEKTADIIIAFEIAEAVRAFKYLKPNGVIVVANKTIQPTTASLSGKEYDSSAMLQYLRNNTERVVVVDTDEICKVCKSSKVTNVALIGAAALTGALRMTKDEIAQTIKNNVPAKFIDMNIQALNMAKID